jgi:hypothetical protein
MASGGEKGKIIAEGTINGEAGERERKRERERERERERDCEQDPPIVAGRQGSMARPVLHWTLSAVPCMLLTMVTTACAALLQLEVRMCLLSNDARLL